MSAILCAAVVCADWQPGSTERHRAASHRTSGLLTAPWVIAVRDDDAVLADGLDRRYGQVRLAVQHVVHSPVASTRETSSAWSSTKMSVTLPRTVPNSFRTGGRPVTCR